MFDRDPVKTVSFRLGLNQGFGDRFVKGEWRCVCRAGCSERNWDKGGVPFGEKTAMGDEVRDETTPSRRRNIHRSLDCSAL